MKRFSLILLIVLIGAGAGISGEKFKFPVPKIFRLKNGLKVFYIKDDLPRLSIGIYAGFGQLYEKRNNAGIASLLAKTLSIGGSKNNSGGALHEKIESIGGRFSSLSSFEITSVSVTVLARYSDMAFSIMKDMVQNPDFSDNYLDTAKNIIIEDIKRKSDEPDMIAIEKAREIIFDGDSYGAVPTESTIRSITSADLSSAWNEYFTTGNMYVGIIGPYENDFVEKLAEEAFSSVKKGERKDYHVDLARLEARAAENKNRIFFIEKNIPQSTIVIGSIAPGAGSEGNHSLTLMNYILGGGSFTSRLMNEVRVKRGLAYSVTSVMRFRKNTGLFMAFAQTKNESADDVISIMSGNIAEMSRTIVTDEELQWAKSAITNSFIFRFDTPQNVMANFIDLEYNGLPQNYYDRYPDKINSVTKKDIIENSSKIFNRGLIRVVLGSPDVKDELQKYGEVVTICGKQ